MKMKRINDSVLHDEPTEFVFRGKKHKLGWLRKGTMMGGGKAGGGAAADVDAA